MGRLNSSRSRFRVHGSRSGNDGARLAWRHRTPVVSHLSCAIGHTFCDICPRSGIGRRWCRRAFAATLSSGGRSSDRGEVEICLEGIPYSVERHPQGDRSFVLHLIQAWIHVLLGWALQIEIPFSYSIILYPLVGTFAAIPISLNGIGLREGGYLFLLGLIGINAEKGVAFGLLLFLIVAVDSLIGGVLFLMNRGANAADDALARSV